MTNVRPHGLKYSLTLHRSDNTRRLWFDNAHGVKSLQVGYGKKIEAFDHWHRSEFNDGKPYEFRSVLKLLEDFYAAVDHILSNEDNQVRQESND